MEVILECNSLTKLYDAERGIQDVSFKVNKGKIIGLLGPNGSGKSTLLKLITGMLTPTKGEVLVAGKKPGKESKKIISYLPERNCLSTWMRVQEVVGFYEDFYGDFDKEKAFNLLSEMKISLKDPIKTLSKGTQEKVQLIMSMSRQAKLYCLDEPIVGVDPAARDFIINTIINNKNAEAALIISTHLILDVETILDEVIFIQNGRIVLNDRVSKLKESQNMSIDQIFRRMYKQ